MRKKARIRPNCTKSENVIITLIFPENENRVPLNPYGRDMI